MKVMDYGGAFDESSCISSDSNETQQAFRHEIFTGEQEESKNETRLSQTLLPT